VVGLGLGFGFGFGFSLGFGFSFGLLLCRSSSFRFVVGSASFRLVASSRIIARRIIDL
jgi:hypothetical protein